MSYWGRLWEKRVGWKKKAIKDKEKIKGVNWKEGELTLSPAKK